MLDKNILIGYDTRNKADDFAFFIAQKLADFGFNVEISDTFVATPVLAFNALNKKSYAIMITASHNPPEYLGIKFIPPYGGPAEDYMVKEIVDNLENQFNPQKSNGKYRYFWLYRVKFGIPSTSLQTKGDSITFSTPSIEGTVMRRNKLDGQNKHPWKTEVTEGDTGVSSSVISGWFSAVYEPDFETVVNAGE